MCRGSKTRQPAAKYRNEYNFVDGWLWLLTILEKNESESKGERGKYLHLPHLYKKWSEAFSPKIGNTKRKRENGQWNINVFLAQRKAEKNTVHYIEIEIEKEYPAKINVYWHLLLR